MIAAIQKAKCFFQGHRWIAVEKTYPMVYPLESNVGRESVEGKECLTCGKQSFESDAE